MRTRDRILDAATRRIGEVDYPAFTVASVRDELGLSSGSMFHAFPSKAALGAAVYVAGMVDYQQTALAVIAGRTEPVDALPALVERHLGWVEDNPGLTRFLFSTLPGDVAAHAAAPLADHNRRFFAALDDFYERLADDGLMGRIDRSLAHAVAIGPAQEYCRQWVRGSVPTEPRAVAPVLGSAALAALAATTTVPTPEETHAHR